MLQYCSILLNTQWLVQYSLWLDQHSMDDALKFIRGALNAAAAKVDQDEDCKELMRAMTHICSHS